ncbi:hypothetical protein Tco_0421962 [Tanacetum coccineum]
MIVAVENCDSQRCCRSRREALSESVTPSRQSEIEILNAPAGRPLGAYDLGVATPRALVYAGVMTSGNARLWYMISGDAKSWGEVNDHILRRYVLRFIWTPAWVLDFSPFQLKEITIPANEETGQEEEKKMQTMDEFVTLHNLQLGSSYDVALSKELRRSSHVACVPSKSWKSYGVTHRQRSDNMCNFHGKAFAWDQFLAENDVGPSYDTDALSEAPTYDNYEPLVMPLEGIHVDDKLQFVEEPVEIMEREIKRLKRSRIPLVKVRWNSRRGPEFTWEREDSFKQKYPQLFTNRASSSTTRS